MKFCSSQWVLIALSAISAIACSPPQRTLDTEDKLADMYWLFSQFNQNYAPLEYKAQRYGFDYAALKQKYLKDATSTKTNDEFYGVMYRFVAEFKDAHTGASMNNPTLPGRAKIAYLGFNGQRKGDKLLVTEMLPTMKESNSDYPVKVGDLVAKFDGVDLKQVVLGEMVKYRNLGNDESNLTAEMNSIFNRLSIANAMPTAKNATLTLVRDSKEITVTVPWIVKDIVTFAGEQKLAAKKATVVAETTVENIEDRLPSIQDFQIGFLTLDGRVEPFLANFMKFVRELGNFDFWNSFTFINETPAWSTLGSPLKKTPVTPADLTTLAKSRVVPTGAIQITDAKTYPTYVTREKIVGADGKETTATKLVAFMRVHSFSPGVPDDVVAKEFEATLNTLQALGVKDILIDMIDNGGGSLLLGMKMAQLLSPQKVVMPEIQFRLSETWMDDFQKGALSGRDDTRVISQRIFDTLKEDADAGRRLSRKISVESLMAYPLTVNTKLEAKFNVVLMVNEMCASMCDIFTAILKDNQMAVVVGAKTMGAGGNVAEHPAAPNSHLVVRQTESLLLRRDGTTYIENNGIEPDHAMAVNESAKEKYAPVHKKALSLVLKQ